MNGVVYDDIDAAYSQGDKRKLYNHYKVCNNIMNELRANICNDLPLL